MKCLLLASAGLIVTFIKERLFCVKNYISREGPLILMKIKNIFKNLLEQCWKNPITTLQLDLSL